MLWYNAKNAGFRASKEKKFQCDVDCVGKIVKNKLRTN